jgi:hypothetical protein
MAQRSSLTQNLPHQSSITIKSLDHCGVCTIWSIVHISSSSQCNVYESSWFKTRDFYRLIVWSWTLLLRDPSRSLFKVLPDLLGLHLLRERIRHPFPTLCMNFHSCKLSIPLQEASMGTKVLEIHIGLPRTLGYSDTHLKVHVSTPSSRGLNPVIIRGLRVLSFSESRV